jgi:DNA repair protein RadA/Sms
VRETAADLAVAAAVASAARGRALPPDVAVFGEVGLSGEVRSVDRPIPRLREVAALGLTRCVLPRRNEPPRREVPAGLSLVPVGDVGEALAALLGPAPCPSSGRQGESPLRGPWRG